MGVTTMAECLLYHWMKIWELGKAQLKIDGLGWGGGEERRSDGGYEGMQSLGGAGYEGQDYLRRCGTLLH